MNKLDGKTHIENHSRVGWHIVDEEGYHWLTAEQLNKLCRFDWVIPLRVMLLTVALVAVVRLPTILGWL